MPFLRSRACFGACAADLEPGGPFGAASGERVSAHLPPVGTSLWRGSFLRHVARIYFGVLKLTLVALLKNHVFI